MKEHARYTRPGLSSGEKFAEIQFMQYEPPLHLQGGADRWISELGSGLGEKTTSTKLAVQHTERRVWWAAEGLGGTRPMLPCQRP